MTDKRDFVENVKLLADLVNRVGFPILVCVFLGWFVLFKMEEQNLVMRQVAAAIDKLADKIDGMPR